MKEEKNGSGGRGVKLVNKSYAQFMDKLLTLLYIPVTCVWFNLGDYKNEDG